MVLILVLIALEDPGVINHLVKSATVFDHIEHDTPQSRIMPFLGDAIGTECVQVAYLSHVIKVGSLLVPQAGWHCGYTPDLLHAAH
jgi:hypothetical protein